MQHKLECIIDFTVGILLVVCLIVLLPVKWLDEYLIERRNHVEFIFKKNN